jgi:hypothetical protein
MGSHPLGVIPAQAGIQLATGACGELGPGSSPGMTSGVGWPRSARPSSFEASLCEAPLDEDL